MRISWNSVWKIIGICAPHKHFHEIFISIHFFIKGSTTERRIFVVENKLFFFVRLKYPVNRDFYLGATFNNMANVRFSWQPPVSPYL